MNFLQWLASLFQKPVSIPKTITKPGWPFTVQVVGDDLVIENVYASNFGDAKDVGNNPISASGLNTVAEPNYPGCSLPLDYGPTSGSPIPKVPWYTVVMVTAMGKTVTTHLVDDGPSNGLKPPRAIDLTDVVFEQFAPLGQGLISGVTVRIVGGAQYL